MQDNKPTVYEWDNALSVPQPRPNEYMLGLTPETALLRAKDAVKAVVAIINSREKPLIVNGKRYVEYQDWRLLALYFGITTRIDNVQEVNETVDNRVKFIGYIVEVSARKNNEILTTATGECTRYEKNWLNKERPQVREMATIRAKRSALKDVLRWVFSMAELEVPEVKNINPDIDEEPEMLL